MMRGPTTLRAHMDSAVSATQLDPLWPDNLRTLVSRGEPRRYRKGTMLIHEGDTGDTLFIVMSGSVKAFSTNERGREIIYGVYGAGEYMGEMSLDGGPRSASVITLETTVCSVVTRKTLREHIAANPEFAFELLSRVIRRARLATQSVRGLALIDVYGRLTQLLNEMSSPRDDGSRVIGERLTHRDIASRVGCSREMVSRLLKDLQRGGYVSVERSQLVLHRHLPAEW